MKVPLTKETEEQLLQAVPFTVGSEYITARWLSNLFGKLQQTFAAEIAAYDGSVENYLAEKSQALHVPERVFFHLVENKDDTYPFAFLATVSYTHLDVYKRQAFPRCFRQFLYPCLRLFLQFLSSAGYPGNRWRRFWERCLVL